MNECILHVGMPKTGSTSIQDSLFHGLSDPGFRYLCHDGSSGLILMNAIFRHEENNAYFYQKRGWSARYATLQRITLKDELEQALAAAAHGQCKPILSAESIWAWTMEELQGLQQFLAQHGYTARVVAYLRLPKPWLESWFQQTIKKGNCRFQVYPKHLHLNYSNRIQNLETVFGSERLEISTYDARSFPDGCVVQDFYQRLGIAYKPAQIKRSNDSLKLPALQFLYTYHKFSGKVFKGRHALEQNERLIHQLSDLEGPPLRLHSSLIEPYREEFERQRAWVEQRLGTPFSEDIYCHDQEPCLRQEFDFFDFSPDALRWLASATGNRPVNPAGSEAGALKVAAQVHQLAQGNSFMGRLRTFFGNVPSFRN